MDQIDNVVRAIFRPERFEIEALVEENGSITSLDLQALSHFSYHATGGKFVLCDLQGGVYKVRNLIAVSIQFEYDPDELAMKITTQLVHRSNSKTYVW